MFQRGVQRSPLWLTTRMVSSTWGFELDMKQLVDLQPLQGLLGEYLCAKLQRDRIWILLSPRHTPPPLYLKRKHSQTVGVREGEYALREGLPVEAVLTEECIVPLLWHNEWPAFEVFLYNSLRTGGWSPTHHPHPFLSSHDKSSRLSQVVKDILRKTLGLRHWEVTPWTLLWLIICVSWIKSVDCFYFFIISNKFYSVNNDTSLLLCVCVCKWHAALNVCEK